MLTADRFLNLSACEGKHRYFNPHDTFLKSSSSKMLFIISLRAVCEVPDTGASLGGSLMPNKTTRQTLLRSVSMKGVERRAITLTHI